MNTLFNEIMTKRFSKDSLISIATSVNNIPYCRTVDSFYIDGSFYVITYALSNKMRQISLNPLVAISGEWFTGHGKAVNLGFFGKKENEDIARQLTDAFSSWINNGHNDFQDENTIILEIKLTDGVVFSKGKRYEL